MSANKPPALIVKNETLADREARVAAAASVRPKIILRVAPPPSLRGHKEAWKVWKRLRELYDSIDATIATAFDEDLLVQYCLIYEEVFVELPSVRDDVKTFIEQTKTRIETIEDPQLVYKMTVELSRLYEKYKAYDARLDAKRKFMERLMGNLYLTPRARAGVAPPEKAPKGPVDDMEKLLMNDV